MSGRHMTREGSPYPIDSQRQLSRLRVSAIARRRCLFRVEAVCCRWHVAVDIFLLAVRRLVAQGGSTALEQHTKKPGFFC